MFDRMFRIAQQDPKEEDPHVSREDDVKKERENNIGLGILLNVLESSYRQRRLPQQTARLNLQHFP